MAVEARQANLFPSKTLANREFAGGAFGYGVVSSAEAVVPAAAYSSALTHAVKSDSGLTYAAAAAAPRKRPRDDVTGAHMLASSPPPLIQYHNPQIDDSNNMRCAPFTFLGEDISLHLQQQQMDLDRFIALHTENARIEIEQRRKTHSRRTTGTIEESPLMKKLRAKEEEFEKIGKLNSLLEERVKSLCLENQIWRDLAQTNEATANALRSNLEQVLAQVQQEQHKVQQQEQFADDAESSCCASNSNEEKGIGLLNFNSMCKSCGGEESCVLLLPCRHLCLCTVCGSRVHTCPVCYSTKTASLHVNLSSS